MIGSWGEQISEADFRAESAACFPLIVSVCVHILAWADCDVGDVDAGKGDDRNGDGVGDGGHITRFT
jgi:hypothetical protein